MINGMDITDGNWHAATLGEFAGMLIDLGNTAAVTFRVIVDSKLDENGTFARTMEIVLYPNGMVIDALSGCHSVHKLLQAFIDNDIVT